MKKILLVLAFALTALSGWSQPLIVQGYVRDVTQMPVANHMVLLGHTWHGSIWDTVYTDNTGYFFFAYSSAPSTQGAIFAVVNCSPNNSDTTTGYYSPANMTVNLNLVYCQYTQPTTFGWLSGWVSPIAAGDTADVSLYAMRGGAIVLDTIITVWDTSSAGIINYSFRTAPGSYLVKAELRAGSVNAGTYLPTYYGQTTLQHQAAVINVQGGVSTNVNNITLLTTASTNLFFVSGTVNGFTPAVAAMDTVRVILIEINNNIWTPVDTIYATDSARNGSAFYWFRTANAGTYSVLATLMTGNATSYIPTYFGNVSTWGAANQFTFNPANLQRSANITLIPGSGTGGGGGSRIRGGIFPGLPFVSTGGIAGIQVQLMDAQDNVLLATHSRTDGSYELGNLPFGTYKVRVEHFGLTSAVSTVTLDANNPNADDVNFSISGNTVSTSIEEAQLSVNSVYPNPARDEVHLLLLAKEGQERIITLRDLQGRVVSTLTVQLQSGEQNISFPLDGIAPGMYMLAVDGHKPSLHKLIVQ